MMASVPYVNRICLYPVKGLAPVRVSEAPIGPSGALELDRRWTFVDSRDRFVNGKNRTDLHTIPVAFDLSRLEICLDARPFSLVRQQSEIARWMSDRLGEPIELREDRTTGFPDDTSSPGPTLVTTGSLAQVASWFDLSVDSARLRFRANVELDGVDAFWEDRWYGTSLRLGDVLIQATNPCQRCVVPSRDALTGMVTEAFQRRFADNRERALSSDVDPVWFSHSYRFAVNTRIPRSECGKWIREGDDAA